MSAQQWQFTQLGGPGKTMVLNGWSAPFGRPRHGAIVDAGLEIRETTTYYPGNSEPTVHAFGVAPHPWELSGRFMDQALGLVGQTKLLRRQWYDFIGDQQEVRATWGDILSYRIFLKKIELRFESEFEVAWKLTAVVLADEGSVPASFPTPSTAPAQYGQLLKELGAAANPWQAPAMGNLLNLLPQISDQIDNLISAINTPFGYVYDLCTELSDFETASTLDLAKMGSGLQALKTGYINLRQTTDFMLDSAEELSEENALLPFGGVLSSADQRAMAVNKAVSDANIENMLSLIAEMQGQISATTRGNIKQLVQAQDGDTWESIATRTMGGPDGSRSIRDMNAVRHGRQPLGGQKYTIPSQ